MATVMIEEKMYIDLPQKEDLAAFYDERKEVARVRVMESARGSGEMIGWLQYQADEEERNPLAGYRLSAFEGKYCPDLGDWLVERSGVRRIDWESMVAPAEVWEAMIARFS